MDVIEPASKASLPDRSAAPDFQYERPDWTLFRSINTLPQKAGVEPPKLRRLVLKELVDNALDAGAVVRVGNIGDDPNAFFVSDDGPGIDPDKVPHLFSINRPLVSSKLWRLPSRGAMGNGLRVVMGAVIASGGRIAVRTRGKRLALIPQEDGTTTAEVSDVEEKPGTQIHIWLGDAIPADDDAIAWARTAARMSPSALYTGKSSAWWYDADAFHELLQAAGERPVRSLVADLDGCSGAKAGQIANAFKGRPCSSMTREEAVRLLLAAREAARPVRAERLVLNGDMGFAGAYDMRRTQFMYGAREPLATLPVTVEAWAASASSFRPILVLVNRTPVTEPIWSNYKKGIRGFYGCGVSDEFEFPSGDFAITINVTTPHCPITTDGKEPNLRPFWPDILEAMRRAVRKAKRDAPKQTTETGGRLTAKAVVIANLPAAIEKASGGGRYRFNQRQLFYIARPFVMSLTGKELTYGNFEGIVAEYENDRGDIPGMYRDPRGSIYHPHTGETLPLGTLAVEEYRRPSWTFNKLLYIEKEGLFESLKADRWPERHDCALVTSKGYTTHAVKDLLDLLGPDGEDITVFCIHDADAAGTMIHQTLQEGTRARPMRRSVHVINLGLEPWEGIQMGLEVENVDEKGKTRPVARYVVEREDGTTWKAWLQEKRIELNAMTTAAFIAWLDAKMEEHDGEKVKPPADVLVAEMRERTAAHLRQIITDRVLKEARIDDQVQARVEQSHEPDGARLSDGLEYWFGANEDELWKAYIDGKAEEEAQRVERS